MSLHSFLFIGKIYIVTADDKCYYNNHYIPITVFRNPDLTIESAQVDFIYTRENIEPNLYEELGFKEKEICPRNGQLHSCWQLNRL